LQLLNFSKNGECREPRFGGCFVLYQAVCLTSSFFIDFDNIVSYLFGERKKLALD
jgi:hypothetical protein